MAIKYLRIGNAEDVMSYDDADYASAIETDAPIKSGTPVDPTDVLRLVDVVSAIGSSIWPIGSVFISVVSTNPNTLLGFGTWARIAEAQLLVGFKTGDGDFGVVEATGGSKTHTHAVDVDSVNSGTPSATETVDNVGSGSTVSVAKSNHTHAVDPASKTSGNNSSLPPFFVVYVWKRTS